MEVIDFVHYMNTGEVVSVEPCGKDGHNYRHISVYELADRFFIFCNLCRESALGLDADDFYSFLEGINPEYVCQRPYHNAFHVYVASDGTATCKRCLVVVRPADHPSHNTESSWYG